MGYANKNNPIQQLVDRLFKMHKNALKRDSKNYVFYYKDVLDILQNPVVAPYLNSEKLIFVLKSNNYSYFNLEKLKTLQDNSCEFFDLLFSRWDTNPLEILEKIKQIILIIKSNLEVSQQEDKIIKTFLFAVFKVINKLISYCSKNDFVKDIDTLESIYKQVIDLAEVSFEGEPLSGLQIMGVLETRVLDFDTVIITSLNEGKFPAGKTTNSFIPYDVKKELELHTFKEKDAVYTYHFYHLLQRAKNIYLLYNTENDGLDGGEKSRFITQLEVEKQANHILTHEIYNPVLPEIANKPMIVPKSESVMARLKEICETGFSPSALTSYIRNPIDFYFQKILRIKDVEEVEENIAIKTLGTIIHKTLEALYKPLINKYLTQDDIDNCLKILDEEVLKQFKLIYKEGEIKKGRNLLAFEVAKRNISNFLKLEATALNNGDSIKVLFLEKTFERTIKHKSLPYPVLIKGNVDRIEERNGSIRITDYKTGKVEKTNLTLKSWNGLTEETKNDKIIQLLAYAFIFENKSDQLLEAGIISFKNLKNGFLPFNFKQDKIVNSVINDEIIGNYLEQIVILLNEILDKSIPFEEKKIL